MLLNVDLHNHSNQSDGILSPSELALRAHGNQVQLWALTDHDETSGLEQARLTSGELGLNFISGVEISASFCGKTIHIVGLNFDEHNAELLAGLAQIRNFRLERSQAIAAKLEGLGIEDAFNGAMQFVSNPRLIGRVHFAKFLLQEGHCKTLQHAFDRYLGENKSAFVPMQWVGLEQAVNWLKQAGGKSVIAHPASYNYKKQQLTALLDTFKDLGGDALEVVTGSHNQYETEKFAKLALIYGLQASRGSDFHAPDIGRIDIGKMPNLPPYLTPVWQDWI